MEFYQTELNIGIASVSGNPHAPIKPAYDPYWDELLREEQSTCDFVREQVNKDTKKIAPEHEKTNHWVEKYWVKRGSSKYWYWRYIWMEGRKLRRRHLGSTSSPKVKNLKRIIEDMILEGSTPQEITNAIDYFATTTQIH